MRTLRVRLWRKGLVRKPHYYIVVIDSTKRHRGPYVEKLGFYAPRVQGKYFKFLTINLERLAYWVSRDVYINRSVLKLLGRMIGPLKYGFKN